MRDKYISKYGVKAYQKAFLFVAIGIPIVISVIVHSFFPTDLIARYGDIEVYRYYLGTPIFVETTATLVIIPTIY